MKMMIAVICTLLSFSSIAENNPEPQVLTLKGFFLSASIVKYEVCVVSDTVCEPMSIKTGLRSYNVDLEVGKTYAIEFTKKEITKIIYITVGKAGSQELDVDFNNPHSCEMYYHKKKRRYQYHVLEE